VIGQGMVPVSRKKEFSIRKSGATAINAALADAGLEKGAVGALYVGNMLSGILSNQQHIGVLLATEAGLSGVEAATVEACCGSGGSALRWGYMSILSGIHDTVVVAGVEAMTHVELDPVTKGLAAASDWDSEGGQGETFVSLNGILMDLYIKQYGVDRESFLPFAMTAHQNALTSPHALLKKPVTADDYRASKARSGGC
jgi:acetyl-CoA C-acetyltransferase